MTVIDRIANAVPTEVRDYGGTQILVLRDDADASDIKRVANELIREAWSYHAAAIAIPVGCMSPDFFQLRTGVAGALIQKLVNYRLIVAFVGAIPQHFLESQSLGDFIRECNRGRSTWFLNDMDELAARLAARNR
ncbi:MAG: Uncharacterized protein JWM58_3903 [Rhizobium sp.]|nr:Uncharacterized protein [Rhizobium sp.]